ncbi:MAG: hypothetical protein CMI74_00580 [Candidatus Pelagibacter sp.]|nr:hypothetical protein [Candidatus Pelagibacter sp.]
MMKNKILIFLIFFIIFFSTSSCVVTPSSGQREISLMSEEDEKAIGKTEHPKIIKQFGGVYQNNTLQNYIESLGKFLVSTSESPNLKFTFTILNSPIVNAFALPGGYIYLTRGLIYLCQNEAQLAGVIAHEIGHVTGRHSAKRYTTAVGTNLLGNILNTLIKNPILQNLTNTTSSLYLLSYSRQHEYEADNLATRYMIRAGFKPTEMANFLKQMENYSKLQKKIIGDKKKVSELLLTHPNSSKRVMEVINSVDDSSSYKPIIGREVFLKKIDGMLYGDKPEEGFFYKNTFIHKPLDFFFNFDDSIFFINNPKFLLGLAENETKIFFDIDNNKNQDDLEYFSSWTKTPKKKILNYNKETINNYIISKCVIKRSDKTIGLAIIKDDKNLYRFSITSDSKKFEDYKKKFNDMVYSFGKVSANQNVANIEPPKVRILKNSSRKGYIDDVIENSSLQKKFSKDIFMTLNEIDNSEANKKIKTIY